MNQGYLIVYTGNGKGKTTAALGLALRMMGHGLKVCLLQFIKSQKETGEYKIKKHLGGLYTCHMLGQGFIITDADQEKNRELSLNAWEFSKKIITSGEYDLIILDELTHLLSLKLLDETEVLDFLMKRPSDLHIIITGRDAPASFLDKADLATEMREVKHPFLKGIKARKGIEW
jgi:cob(I)alamin adenosyltransferase